MAFNRSIIDASAPYAAAFKFNMAFYEANGASGWRQLAASLELSCANDQPDILTICDAKRGDIGNTSAAYARSIFDELGFDAVTLNPYLGRDALQPFLDYEEQSLHHPLPHVKPRRRRNTESGRLPEGPLWQVVAEKVAGTAGMKMATACWSQRRPILADMARIRSIAGDMTLLVPGIGAQGGDMSTPSLRAGLNSAGAA